MRKVLKKNFFNRSALIVAPELLGKYLVVNRKGIEEAYIITETEAYDGLDDLASHASKGITARTEIMFGEAGKIYIYLIYGMYYMLNIVTDKKNYPSAILIRGVKGLDGPGKLTKKLGITKAFNTRDALPKNGLWFEDRGEKVIEIHIKKSPRIGVDYAGPIWAKKEYRFILENYN
ncbi:MAG: DNA-3-methyladenine glycosylase [Nitrosopumilus sp.]|nr:DNA-3-methyladenine glycosylase [Nitrosopumilus sp.]MBA3550976.1 DNA-3-methyladenine glycosylase [Patescibacteria group bacterium]